MLFQYPVVDVAGTEVAVTVGPIGADPEEVYEGGAELEEV